MSAAVQQLNLKKKSCFAFKVDTQFSSNFSFQCSGKNSKHVVALNRRRAWYSETSEPCGALCEARMTNYTLVKKKKNHFAWVCRKSLRQLPDEMCQQLRTQIDLRLPNCRLIKERSSSVPFFLLILTLFIWFCRGHSWAQCVARLLLPVNVCCNCRSLFSFRYVRFTSLWDPRGGCAASGEKPQRVTKRSNM